MKTSIFPLVLFLFMLCLLSFSNAKDIKMFKKIEAAHFEEEAIEKAHWLIFEEALNEILGQSGYVGNVSNSFQSDMNKDFLAFQNTHFRQTKTRCNNLEDSGFECLVITSIDLDKLRSIISVKSNSSTVIGKNSLDNLSLVLIDNVNNELSIDFTKELHATSLDLGTELIIEKKGTMLGSKGNACNEIRRKKALYEKKGRSYIAAVKASQKKLQECMENIDVEYLFQLNKVSLKLFKKNNYGNFSGILNYRISMFNTQTGKEDNAIRSKAIKSSANNIQELKSNLFSEASKAANIEMTSNLLKVSNKKLRNKNKKIVNKYKYFYTVILRGLTNEKSDRKKRNIIKNEINFLNDTLKKNFQESTDFEQVYNFGSNKYFDIETLIDNIYDVAESSKFKILIANDDEYILVINF